MYFFILTVVGLIAIAWFADLLVEGAVALSRRHGVPELVVGLTLCAFGTSAPELFVNAAAALEGRHALVEANVLGSNVFNTLVVLGVGALVTPLAVARSTRSIELPAQGVVMALFLLLANDAWLGHGASVVSRWDALVLLGGFVVFVVYAFTLDGTAGPDDDEVPLTSGWAKIYVLAGLFGLPLAAELVVHGASGLALLAGVSEKAVGLTLVSAGTSLPELAATAAAAWKGRADLAVGNVVGSNLFNVLLVLGVSALLRPIEHVPALSVDALFFVGCTGGVWLACQRGTLGRRVGLGLLATFGAYLLFLFGRELA
ncbi:MAG: sodium:calcium antiporter [Myxococcota bacterium]